MKLTEEIIRKTCQQVSYRAVSPGGKRAAARCADQLVDLLNKPESKKKEAITELRKRIVKAALSWYNYDSPEIGRPSGLRMLTTGSIWNPNRAETRLARRIAELNIALAAAEKKARKK